MATKAKKKSPAKKQPALKKKSNKVNPYLIAIGAISIAIIGAIVVRMSFAATATYWPKRTYEQPPCGGTLFNARRAGMPVLGKGNRGSCVSVLQQGLQRTGFMSKTLKADGIFGQKTKDSVFLLQSYFNLRSKDGVVGRCTWYALQGTAIYGKSNKTKVVSYTKAQEKIKPASTRCF